MDSQLEFLKTLCHQLQGVWFEIEWSNAEGIWHGYVRSIAPSEDEVFKYRSTAKELLSDMIAHVEKLQ